MDSGEFTAWLRNSPNRRLGYYSQWPQGDACPPRLRLLLPAEGRPRRGVCISDSISMCLLPQWYYCVTSALGGEEKHCELHAGQGGRQWILVGILYFLYIFFYI
jgi:hypothetical protein